MITDRKTQDTVSCEGPSCEAAETYVTGFSEAGHDYSQQNDIEKRWARLEIRVACYDPRHRTYVTWSKHIDLCPACQEKTVAEILDHWRIIHEKDLLERHTENQAG